MMLKKDSIKIRCVIPRGEGLARGPGVLKGKQAVGDMRWLAFLLSMLWLFYGSAVFAERLAIKSNMANIRSGPGTQHDVLWQVEKFHPIEVIDKNGKWYRFRDFEGDEGWVHASLVGKIPAVITKNDKNNVRSGPGTGYKIKFTVEKGIPFRVLQRKKKWVYVRHADGDKGWIHSSLLW